MPYVINPVGMNKCVGCLTCAIVCSVSNKDDHSIDKSAIKVRTTGGMTSRFVAVVCRGCREPACRDACPVKALKLRPGGGVILQEEICSGCRRCLAACSVNAVVYDVDAQKPIICFHCGVCTTFCTHDCLVMVEVEGGNSNAK